METIEAIEIANLCKSGVKGYNEMNGRIYDADGASPTIRANSGGHNEIKILEPLTCAMRGRNPNNPSDRTAGINTQQRLEIGGAVANTLTTVQKDCLVYEPPIRVRKLTPRETWRLMGFADADFDKAQKYVSNSQLYKQAGNSIVVDVLMAIFKEML